MSPYFHRATIARKASGKDESVTIQNNRTHSIGKDETLSVAENRKGGGRQERNGDRQRESRTYCSSAKGDTLRVGTELYIEVANQITIKTGEASLVMMSNGDIQLSGKNITLTGTGKVTEGQSPTRDVIRQREQRQNQLRDSFSNYFVGQVADRPEFLGRSATCPTK